MEIYDSARKHGVSDDDIEHAVSNAFVSAEDDEGKVLYIGPDCAGNLLEVVAVQREEVDELVIHAMALRRTYRELLPEPDESND